MEMITYYRPYFGAAAGAVSVASVDMLRLKLVFKEDALGVFDLDLAKSFSALPVQYWHTRNPKPSQTFNLWVFDFGDATATLGWQYRKNPDLGFLEFNPNKLGYSVAFRNFLDFLYQFVYKTEVMRFDAAFDIPCKRSAVKLMKDRRNYELIVGDSVTEYLGVRNSVGRVKLYDKTYESGLDYPLTRLEITYRDPCNERENRRYFPSVLLYRQNSFDTSKPDGALLMLLAERCFSNFPNIEDFWKDWDYRTRQRYRKTLESAFEGFPFPSDIFEHFSSVVNSFSL